MCDAFACAACSLYAWDDLSDDFARLLDRELEAHRAADGLLTLKLRYDIVGVKGTSTVEVVWRQ